MWIVVGTALVGRSYVRVHAVYHVTNRITNDDPDATRRTQGDDFSHYMSDARSAYRRGRAAHRVTVCTGRHGDTTHAARVHGPWHQPTAIHVAHRSPLTGRVTITVTAAVKVHDRSMLRGWVSRQLRLRNIRSCAEPCALTCLATCSS